MKIQFKQSIAGPKYAYSRGEVAEFNKKEAIRLCEKGIAQPLKEKVTETSSKFPKHTGGGWYELSNGEKVQGKEHAVAAEDELKNWGD